MKESILLFLFGIITISALSQEDLNKSKYDSIIKEANLLYSYEKATWSSTDLANSNVKLKNNIGSYIVHHSNDTVFAVFADKNLENQIAKYSFTFKNLKVPIDEDFKEIPLSSTVQELFQIKNTILNQLNSNPTDYEFNFKKGFNPNPILIPENNGFKLYLIIGTANPNVIPFGNDYLFKANKKGVITDWKKFHKTLIATQTKGPNNEIVISVIHTHLPMTPEITATDICTFRLYGVDLFGMNEFMVSSTALNKIFKYSANTNSISEIDL